MRITANHWLAIIYGLLAAFLLILAALFTWVEPVAIPTPWIALRWLLRLSYVAGALIGWWRLRGVERPSWWYVWLGFATYEAVALLLMAMFRATAGITRLDSRWAPLGLSLGLLAFTPYVLVALWVARTRPALARLTVLPHAALTFPLFYLAIGPTFTGLINPTQPLAALLPTLVAGLAATVLIERSAAQQARWLLIATWVCQLLFWVGIALGMRPFGFLLLAAPFGVLATLILLGPESLWLMDERLRPLVERLGRGQTAPVDPPASFVSTTRLPGESTMSEPVLSPAAALPAPRHDRLFEWLFRAAVIVLAALAIVGVIVFIGRASIYKIHEYERGLHLRGGRFISVKEPGWHVQIPLVDTVIIVKVNERLGYVEQLSAMAADNVTMLVSLQYTYRVVDPQQFALEVDDPERIVFEFVQGKLRDVINTKPMDEVMDNRSQMSQEIMAALQEKEAQYGVRFVTVQIQSASPPEEVLTAIKDRMVAGQRQEQAQAEAAQRQTQADADYYVAQKQAEAQAYQITTTAEAEAQRIRLTTEAQQLAVRAIVAELEGKGALGEKYIEYLIAEQLKENSKWIISGDSTPMVDLRPTASAD
jgi:regulator of protease activity HflC (stomatin/prohibitin superfamily)